jgi:hypothetical protein
MNAEENERELCERLRRLEPGMLPRAIFHEIARLVVTVTFVAVPLLERNGRIHVILKRRPADDLYYAGMLNAPGTIIRATDGGLAQTYERLVAAELADLRIAQGPVFVGHVFDRIVRGSEVSLIHRIRVLEPVDLCDTYDVANLPSDLIATDVPRILMAADHLGTASEA